MFKCSWLELIELSIHSHLEENQFLRASPLIEALNTGWMVLALNTNHIWYGSHDITSSNIDMGYWLQAITTFITWTKPIQANTYKPSVKWMQIPYPLMWSLTNINALSSGSSHICHTIYILITDTRGSLQISLAGYTHICHIAYTYSLYI